MNKGQFTSERLSGNKFAATHGLVNTGAYSSWSHAKNRCLSKKHLRYKDYGGRGITICESWLKFENFYADMGERPLNMSLDRIDVNGNYEPKNCRWATRIEQQRNRRDNQIIFIDGYSLSIHEAAIKYDIGVGTLRYRLFIKKMEVKEAVTKPVRIFRKAA